MRIFLFWTLLIIVFVTPDSSSQTNELSPLKLGDLFKKTDQIFSRHPDSAIAMVNSAYHFAIRNKDLIAQVRCLNTLAYYNFYANFGDKGERDAIKAVQTSRHLGLDSLIGDAYVTLGSILSGGFRFKEAIEEYQLAQQYYPAKKMPARMALVFFDLGRCYREMGVIPACID